MNHKQSILEAFHQNGGAMTLGFILSHPWGYEFRARATELRRQGFVITCTKGKRASDNVYRLEPAQPELLSA
jgi:hypothetical protein